MGRLVPADELPDAFLDADGGPVAELALGPAQIGGREMHVAGLVGRGLHDGLPTERAANQGEQPVESHPVAPTDVERSEEHTSELQSPCNLVCRLLLEKKKKIYQHDHCKPLAGEHDSYRC